MKTRKDVSLHDPIGTDKEGNEITLIILDDDRARSDKGAFRAGARRRGAN